MASADRRDELTCSVCLDIYTDPVTLPCGHSFCRLCIADVLDTQDGSGTYKCPECRAGFKERPALVKTKKLQNIAERFQFTHPEPEEAAILCAYCIQSPVLAAKICLLCEASLCENHLKVHSKSEEHVLTELTTSSRNRKCSVHKEILKYYCCRDTACICVSCHLDGAHKGHQVEILNEVSERKKKKLRNILLKMTADREMAEIRVQSLQEFKIQVQDKAARVTEDITALIRDIRKQLEALEKRILREMSQQEETVLFQISDLIRQLETEKEDLSNKMDYVEKLCKITDPVIILQEQESDRADYCKTAIKDKNKVHSVGDLDMGLISVTLHAGLTDIAMTARRPCNTVQTSDLLLDINTANNCLTLSSDLKTVSYSTQHMCRPETPERFAGHFPSVLSTRSFSSGRLYWEVEVSESTYWGVAMAYPSIDRKSKESSVDKLWGVGRFVNLVKSANNVNLPDNISCRRLGIYLDYKAGRLSFYNLHDPISHLHTFTATFTEPLLFLFSAYEKGWVRLRILDY